ncbi:MAG: hypothetical protein BWK76_10075 [Desulfobulbaceae bacterium A2]|nr:MAG: hypothetical protein BWK76_10075 [Desulfobulbaceae bacterium A2]
MSPVSSRRFSLGEICDQPWCPQVIRDAVTDFLQHSTNAWGQYTSLLPTLCYFLQKTKSQRVVDLCAGGGGPWPTLYRTIRRAFGASFRIILTDRYPNHAALRLVSDASCGSIVFREEALDACGLPVDLTGFRTLFGSFHHFSDVQAKRILQDAVDSGNGIGVFEMTNRQAVTVLTMLTAPFFVWLHTPKIRPFRWSRLLLTYLFPLIPLVVMVDGIISCLRSYTITEMTELTASLAGAPYEWEIRELSAPRSPFPLIYLIGTPKPS